MARVIGIGGAFVKSKDPRALAAWYRDMLGIAMQDWGGAVFKFKDDLATGRDSCAVWSIHAADSSYYAPSPREFMVNFRVDDLEGLIARLKKKGVAIAGRDDSDPNGRFAWVVDPDGTKVELWEQAKIKGRRGRRPRATSKSSRRGTRSRKRGRKA